MRGLGIAVIRPNKNDFEIVKCLAVHDDIGLDNF